MQFKNYKRSTVKYGHWYGVYTGQTFSKASDLDIDHVVPLAHARRHGADNWTQAQCRVFANDFDNFLVVETRSTNLNQTKRHMNGYRPAKITGVSMVSDGSV